MGAGDTKIRIDTFIQELHKKMQERAESIYGDASNRSRSRWTG